MDKFGTKLLNSWLLGLILIGFWLRLMALIGNVYYTDEFISMLAAKMVAQKGWPIFPSGLFYDHGLLYSLVAGLFINGLGFTEQIARWPVLCASVLMIPLYYHVARRLFNSSLTGLVAAILVTFDTLLVKWGAWARMYSFAHLFVLLLMAWVLIALFKKPSLKNRNLLLLFLAGALFSHSLTFVLLPPLTLLALGLTVFYHRDWLQNRGLWLQSGVATLIIGVALYSVSLGHVGSTISLQDRQDEAIVLPAGLSFLDGFFLPTLDSEHIEDLFDFFLEPSYFWLLWVIGLATLPTLYRMWQRRAKFADISFLFILLCPLLIILEMGVLLTDEWRQSRYMVFLTLPAFLLLSAESLSRLLQEALKLGQTRLLKWKFVVVPGIVLILIGWHWGPVSWDWALVRATGDFDTAYQFVEENWQAGDKIMTEHPAAAYLYMEQMDYYANQVSAKVIEEEEEILPLDRYTGSPLINTVDLLNETLASGERIWLVVSHKHLTRYFEPLFREQIFAQMDYRYQAGSKYVFLSHTFPMPVPANPSHSLDGNFNHMIRLVGYHLDMNRVAPDGKVLLSLYWRPIGPQLVPMPKVFVQLRDGQNQTIAQADHFIYEGLLTDRQWNDLLSSEEGWLRDTADLILPTVPLPPEAGPYHIYIGFYDPDTFERTPVIDDSSGENAVVIPLK